MAVVVFPSSEPHAALAPLDEVVVNLVGLVHGRELTAERNDVLVLLHPVAKHGELVCNLCLPFVNH